MKKTLLLGILLLGIVSVGFAQAYKDTYAHEQTISKYSMPHWMPATFDGTSKTCKFGIVQERHDGVKVCTKRRGPAIRANLNATS